MDCIYCKEEMLESDGFLICLNCSYAACIPIEEFLENYEEM